MNLTNTSIGPRDTVSAVVACIQPELLADFNAVNARLAAAFLA